MTTLSDIYFANLCYIYTFSVMHFITFMKFSINGLLCDFLSFGYIYYGLLFFDGECVLPAILIFMTIIFCL
jgi:hypothetical protein